MSLIPSESSSFADLLGRGLDASKKSKWRAPFPEAPKISRPPKTSPRVALKLEKPQAQRLPERPKTAPASPKPQSQSAATPPPQKLEMPVPEPIAVTEPRQPLPKPAPPPQVDPFAVLMNLFQQQAQVEPPPNDPVALAAPPVTGVPPAPAAASEEPAVEAPFIPWPVAPAPEFQAAPAAEILPQESAPEVPFVVPWAPPASEIHPQEPAAEVPFVVPWATSLEPLAPPEPQPIAPAPVIESPLVSWDVAPAGAPEPETYSAAEPIMEEPMIDDPLVIQPEDEPPRRPIPIVRVPRSKQNPNGIVREQIAPEKTEALPALKLQPSPAPPAKPQSPVAPAPKAQQPPAPKPQAQTAPVASAVPLAIARPRPRPASKPLVQEAVVIPQPAPPAARKQMDPEPEAWLEPAIELEPEPVYQIPARRSQVNDRAWLALRIGEHNFEFRWRGRFLRFLIYEALAIGVLVAAVLVGLDHRSLDDPLNSITRILAIAGAVVAAIIPVLFYGLPERVPRNSR